MEVPPTLRIAGCCVAVLSLAAIAGCSSESAPPTCPDFRIPEVAVFDSTTGDRICDATVTISNNGHIFSCEITGGRCDLPYRCNGPKLGGNYALRVKRGEQCDFEEVVTFDDACDDNQFELSVVLRPPGDGGIAAQP